jgi:hypothetical protein
LGLDGSWPYLSFARAAGPGVSTQGHWKLDAIDAYCGARPLAWIDDAHGDACETWAAAREAAGTATLLVTTEPAVGLTGADVRLLLRWAERLPSAPAARSTRASRTAP